MKAKTISAAVALTGLLTLGGTAFAAEGPHDGYNRGFYGKVSTQTSEADTMGKAAYGTTDTTAWSGHDAYNQAILGKAPSKPESDSMGKAAYGSSSSIDGLAAYKNAFPGD